MQSPLNDWSAYQSRTPTNVVQGEFRVSRNQNDYFSTILGSCVAVCLYDTRNMVGGMNHILLPGNESAYGDSRYGVNLMELLINGVLRQGGSKSEIVAKVFGGGKISKIQTGIGEKNALFVKRFLTDEGIPCVSESLGGTKARKVHFVPTSGLARQMFIEPPKDLQEKEVPKPKVEQSVSDITLF